MLFLLQNCSQSFEILILSRHFWGNVNYVPEIIVILLWNLIKAFYRPSKNNEKKSETRFCSQKRAFFSIWVFFHEHSHDSSGRGRRLSLILLYRFHPFYRHLDISRVISTESSLLYVASHQTQTRNIWFPSESR